MFAEHRSRISSTDRVGLDGLRLERFSRGVASLAKAVGLSLLVTLFLLGTVSSASPTVDEPCASCDASTSCLNGLAAEFAKGEVSLAAQAARYTALADHLVAASAASVAAYADRYAGLAEAVSAAKSASIAASAAR